MIVTGINCFLACFYAKYLFWIIRTFLWMFEKMNPPKIYSYYEAMVSLIWFKFGNDCYAHKNDILLFSVFACKTCVLNYTYKLSFCHQASGNRI